MRLTNGLPVIACVFCFLTSYSQKTGFRKVDEFRLNDSKVKVFFKDPLAELVTALPYYDSMPDPEKDRLLKAYLSNHELYLFSVTSKDGKVTSYVLRGDPEKKEATSKYKIDISDGDIMNQPADHARLVLKSINNLDVSGEFFEHMSPFQQPRFKKVTTTQVWGNIIHINPYAPIRDTVENLIKLDQSAGISEKGK